jgi:hypothetical protein
MLPTSLGIFSQQAVFNLNFLCAAFIIYCTFTLKVCGGSGGCFAISVLCIESNLVEGFYQVFCGNIKGFSLVLLRAKIQHNSFNLMSDNPEILIIWHLRIVIRPEVILFTSEKLCQ